MDPIAPPRIAVLIPACDEQAAIGKVVADFKHVLPDAKVYVYDNNSTDDTAAIAAAAGAILRLEPRQGKGNVIRRMFADIEADAYILVDGDDTYDAAAAPRMLHMLLTQQLDMVNGQRQTAATGGTAYRPGHRTGNRILSGLVRAIFGTQITDMLSGYRVFSRRFVKTFPALAAGFETETELTIHALNLAMPIAEIAIAYRERGANSQSKLRTYRDGIKILRTIISLIKEERPLQFFAIVSLVLLATGIALGTPVVTTYLHTGLVPRLPTAVLAVGIVTLSSLSLAAGLILDQVTRARLEAKRFAYLRIACWEGK